MINDFVFLNRSLLDSRVFGDESLLRLWIWCILKANWKRGWFNDCEIKPGQFATGRSSAAGELNVSGSKWYRGMNRLAEFGMIKMEVVNKQFTVVSVVNWDKYQTQRTSSGQAADKQRTSSEQAANTIEEGYKERREESLEREIPEALNTRDFIPVWGDFKSWATGISGRWDPIKGKLILQDLLGRGHDKAILDLKLTMQLSERVGRIYDSDREKGKPRPSGGGHKPTTFAEQKSNNVAEANRKFIERRQSTTGKAIGIEHE